MNHLITRELLSEAETKFIEKNSSSAINEAYEAHTKRASHYTEVTVFLSHKHTDKDLVRKAIALLNSLGVSVYIDWMDSNMPAATNSSTANALKSKIRNSRKFILLASDDAIESKWCNWELGLGDAAKYIEHIAILPAGTRGRNWKGSEYLGVYPVITSAYEYTPGDYYVEFGNNKTPLDKWLKT